MSTRRETDGPLREDADKIGNIAVSQQHARTKESKKPYFEVRFHLALILLTQLHDTLSDAVATRDVQVGVLG